MSECHRCGGETDQRTLTKKPICSDCTEWYEDHTGSRSASQSSLGGFVDENNATEASEPNEV